MGLPRDGCGHGWRVWLIKGDVVMGVGIGGCGEVCGCLWPGMGDGQGMGMIDCGL